MTAALYMFVKLALFLLLALSQTTDKPGKTVWDGVYSPAQAARGEAAFMQYCVRCHKADLNGIDGALKGEFFMERRREDNLETFFLDVKATMPRGNAGGLPNATYADLIAYVLQANSFPTGNEELKLEQMESIQVIGKDGPQPVPNFAPVGVVGCLVDTGPDTWVLINSSEPVRTRNSFERIEKESKLSTTRAFGPHRFRLQDAENFEAAAHVGKKVHLKGILVRAPAGNRINVNFIEELAPTCN
jgi:mono/diheme cytochrome c family protein